MSSRSQSIPNVIRTIVFLIRVVAVVGLLIP